MTNLFLIISLSILIPLIWVVCYDLVNDMRCEMLEEDSDELN